MDQAGKHFLAGTAFAEQQHGYINIRDQRGLRADLAHLGAGGDEKDVIAEFFDVAGIGLLIGAQALIDHGVQLCFLKWLGEIVMRAKTHGLHHLARVGHAGQHDHFHARLHLAQLLKRLNPVNTGHQQVKQHEIGLHAFLHPLHRFLAGGGRLDFVVVDLEKSPDIAKHPRFVIDQQNLGRFLHFDFPLVVLAATGFRGMRKENLLPAPGSLSTQILPPNP